MTEKKKIPLACKKIGRPKAHENDKPVLPQTPFSALFTEFFIDRNPKK